MPLGNPNSLAIRVRSDQNITNFGLEADLVSPMSKHFIDLQLAYLVPHSHWFSTLSLVWLVPLVEAEWRETDGALPG